MNYIKVDDLIAWGKELRFQSEEQMKAVYERMPKVQTMEWIPCEDRLPGPRLKKEKQKMTELKKKTKLEQIAYLDGCIDTVTTLQDELLKTVHNYLDTIGSMIQTIINEEDEG